ncbi:RNA polymerase sigma-70 factor [Hymenobacter negativus]|uniref:RNA polymerase sigma-70 factor n=1 Tax=Hymenobacter negativus TaxID=2795026 RepID=A0ABS0Q9L5_9BACT|nr:MULTISPECIES: RNA polymerase sigma-70 factor [Bacteria]MBH8558894.1 RNA polymerase sigma-70 factor [Hymenobacter negativus]MBH8567334.1 RNA polymerase sigma-70 factor [Hymenobacter negativus]MBR7207066.1 RNA polymerase sigma-70 factor [Microvirga sp. STS02]
MEIAREFSELDCLRRLNQGDERAFDALFRHYSALVYRFSYGYLKSRTDAEEIVQECFLKIWEKREQLRDDVPLKAYLFTTAHNAILNQLRRQQQRNRFQTYTAGLAPGQVGNEVEFSELESLYQAALEQLPPKRREIFILSRQQGLSYPEIAQQLNLSVKTVEAQMTQALKFLRGYFQAHGESIVALMLWLAIANS